MAQAPANEKKWDENCIKAGGIPYDGDDYRKYKPKGKFEELDLGGDDRMNKLPFYTSDPQNVNDSKGVIIYVYDIFGWNKTNKNIFEFADLLVEKTGFRVIMPDFYRGNPWPLEKFPPTDGGVELGKWWGEYADSKIVVSDLYDKILKSPLVKDKNIGVFGQCWGGLQAIQLGSDSKTFKCVATLHAAKVNDELLGKLEVPVYYGPCQGDYAVDKAEAGIKAANKEAVVNGSVYHNYAPMIHGFSAARGDWAKEDTKKEVDTALTEISEFFGKFLK